MTIGLLTLELHIRHSHSLKEKRQVLRSLKERLRKRFNVSIAELDFQDTWQRSVIGVVTVSGSRGQVEQTLARTQHEAVRMLGEDLISAESEFL